MIHITAAEGKYYFSDVVILTSRQSMNIDEQTLTLDQLEGLKDGYETGRLIMTSGDYTKLLTAIETAPYPSLTGNANKVLAVKATEDDIEWTTALTQVYVDTQDKLLRDQIDLKADAIAVNQSLGTKADLINGLIPASQLPSYVDDVLSFPDLISFPALGEDCKIYIAEDVNKTYRWGGSSYVEIGGGGVALGETSSTAYRGDRGKLAYDHSLSSGNPHGTTTSLIPEGTNRYFNENRVLSTTVTGITFTDQNPITSTDTILQALGKAQSQINVKSVTIGETSVDAYRGDRGKVAYDHSQTVGNPHGTTTGQITETSNLWFTPTRAISSTLTSLSITDTTQVTQLDSILVAIGKLQGQVNTKSTLVLGTTSTTAMAGNTTTSGVAEGTNLYFTDARAKTSTLAAPLTGLSTATGGVITPTDTVLQAVGKLQNQVTNSSSSGMTWVNVTSISTFAYEASVDTANTKIELCKFGGMLWIRGYIRFRSNVVASTEVFQMYNASYLPDYTYVPATLMTDLTLFGNTRVSLDVNTVPILGKWNISTAASATIAINTSFHIRPQLLFKHR